MKFTLLVLVFVMMSETYALSISTLYTCRDSHKTQWTEVAVFQGEDQYTKVFISLYDEKKRTVREIYNEGVLIGRSYSIMNFSDENYPEQMQLSLDMKTMQGFIKFMHPIQNKIVEKKLQCDLNGVYTR